MLTTLFTFLFLSLTPSVGDSISFSTDGSGIPLKKVFARAKVRKNCFIVVSKVHPEHLSVYETVKDDTVLLAVYPACVAGNRGNKEIVGDGKTPESYPGAAFSIKEILDSSEWTHDFGDGRGSIHAYGKYFMRLAIPGFDDIGIHGSTGNRESILKGRGSEGCVRLLDEDIIHLYRNYAFKGMKVIILPEGTAPLPFETRALTARREQ